MRIWSLAIPLLVALPNLLWAKYPAVDLPPQVTAGNTTSWRILTTCEQLGRMSVFVVPVFYSPRPTGIGFSLALSLMTASLLVYYLGWLRFFQGGRRSAHLLQPLWILPIPLAVSPVVYFAAAALLLQSWPMLIAASLLAIGHLPLSYREYRRSG